MDKGYFPHDHKISPFHDKSLLLRVQKCKEEKSTDSYIHILQTSKFKKVNVEFVLYFDAENTPIEA